MSLHLLLYIKAKRARMRCFAILIAARRFELREHAQPAVGTAGRVWVMACSRWQMRTSTPNFR